MVTKLNPKVITDDMMYEGNIEPLDSSWAYPANELDAMQAMWEEEKLWNDICRAAKTNSTLQSALDECIIIYKLSKEYNNGI